MGFFHQINHRNRSGGEKGPDERAVLLRAG